MFWVKENSTYFFFFRNRIFRFLQCALIHLIFRCSWSCSTSFCGLEQWWSTPCATVTSTHLPPSPTSPFPNSRGNSELSSAPISTSESSFLTSIRQFDWGKNFLIAFVFTLLHFSDFQRNAKYLADQQLRAKVVVSLLRHQLIMQVEFF